MYAAATAMSARAGICSRVAGPAYTEASVNS
jgi:hypothetical protein